MVPTIVRIGRSDAINATVRDVTLEELIDKRMAPTTESSKGKNTDMEELRKKHTELMEERSTKQGQLDDARSRKLEPPVGLQVEIDKLSATIRDQRRALDAKRDQKKESSRNAEVLRRRVQQEIMDEAQIICATLSGSGHDMLRNVNVDFETVIIDEAAQSVELSALIPLKFGCEKCILVGDPKQLVSIRHRPLETLLSTILTYLRSHLPFCPAKQPSFRMRRAYSSECKKTTRRMCIYSVFSIECIP